MIRWHIDIELGQVDERLEEVWAALMHLRDTMVALEVGHTWTEERDHVTPGQRNPLGL